MKKELLSILVVLSRFATPQHWLSAQNVPSDSSFTSQLLEPSNYNNNDQNGSHQGNIFVPTPIQGSCGASSPVRFDPTFNYSPPCHVDPIDIDIMKLCDNGYPQISCTLVAFDKSSTRYAFTATIDQNINAEIKLKKKTSNKMNLRLYQSQRSAIAVFTGSPSNFSDNLRIPCEDLASGERQPALGVGNSVCTLARNIYPLEPGGEYVLVQDNLGYDLATLEYIKQCDCPTFAASRLAKKNSNDENMNAMTVTSPIPLLPIAMPMDTINLLMTVPTDNSFWLDIQSDFKGSILFAVPTDTIASEAPCENIAYTILIPGCNHRLLFTDLVKCAKILVSIVGPKSQLQHLNVNWTPAATGFINNDPNESDK